MEKQNIFDHASCLRIWWYSQKYDECIQLSIKASQSSCNKYINATDICALETLAGNKQQEQ